MNNKNDAVTVPAGGLFGLLLVMCILFVQTSGVMASTGQKKSGDPHAYLLTSKAFPRASQCASCHEKIYNEWRSSAHAYAGISPMFHKFEQAINNLAPTIGNFCVRCHMTVGTTMGEKRSMNLWDRSKVSREGVTCITCHRVQVAYGRANGARRIVPGDVTKPIYSAGKGPNLKQVLKTAPVTTDPNAGGRGTSKIHGKVVQFKQLGKSEFCASCHQVAVNLGIKLEVVWEQYRASPAAKAGISCQACHMGKVPGKPSGYNQEYVAKVGGEPVGKKRDHHNHAFYGPGYSIAHPGIFPHNRKAEKLGYFVKKNGKRMKQLVTLKDWLKFNYRQEWGSEAFEGKVDSGKISIAFPEPWNSKNLREKAWEIILENRKAIRDKLEERVRVMENGSHIDGPFFKASPAAGQALKFHYVVRNVSSGHNMPSGSLGAQPELWLNVVLVGPEGKRLWESGYLDSNGDMADHHSLDVRAGKLKHDDQLFNLQTKFLTTNLKGTDREMYLPVNFDGDQLPFLRPATQPTTVMNHPPGVRMEGRSIPPLGYKLAKYAIPAGLMKKPGRYRLSVRLRSRAEPIYFMKFVGATKEMIQSMNEWMIDLHPYTVEFVVK